MELVILMGLQAAGKSTFVRTRLAATHVHVSKDLMRNKKQRQRQQMQRLNVALEVGKSIVVDNTNPTLADRAALIQCGQFHQAEIAGYYFQSRLEDCLNRNQQRKGRARIPDIGLYATAKKLVLPSYAEGFQRLFYVEMASDREFTIQAWQEKMPREKPEL